MKIGVLLPTFRDGASDAFAAADAAERHGLHGVFAYDHLWPMGQPQRPSLAPFCLLSGVAARHATLIVAPLVARVGLVATSVLVDQFRTLAMISDARVIVALGTGDRLSEDENAAYGLAVHSAHERRALIGETARALSGLPLWIGAGAAATNLLAREIGAVLNLWDVSSALVAAHGSDGPVSWAGNARSDLEVQLDELAAAGATWAVFSPTSDVARLGAWRRANEQTK